MGYYVYKHVRLKDGSIFYIGKGKGDRMYSASRRNQYWKRIVEKDGGFTALLIKENISEEEAFELEKTIISEIGINNLTNMTDGGSGGDTRKAFTQDEYDVWLKNKSDAQRGKTGYWKNKKRPDHSYKVKKVAELGVYKNNGNTIRTDEWKQNQSVAASNRIRKKVKCDKCGKEIPNTHLAVHMRGKKCLN
jgi:hypothetical protein